MIALSPLKSTDMDIVQEVQARAFAPEFLEPVSLFSAIQSLYPQGCFLIYQQDRVAGYLFTHPAHSTGEKYETKPSALGGDEDALYIHDLCLDPDFHGQGIAQDVCARLEDIAKTQGFQVIIGVAIAGVQTFWEKQGYTMLKPYSYYGQPAQFMRKDIA